MAKIIGNHGAYQRRPGSNFASSGVGIQAVGPIVGAWSQIAGKAGDVVPVTVNMAAYIPVKIGIFVQSSAAATVRYSLDNVALAGDADPLVRENATWSDSQTLSAGDIVEVTPRVFTVAEVSFTADGIVTFYAR